MGAYGAAVSQKGYDVKTCDDRFLVYSSAFQTLKVFSVSSVSAMKPDNDYNSFSVNASTNVFTTVDNILRNGDPVQVWSDGTLPSPLQESTTYYVISKSGNTYKLSTTSGGSEIDITNTGSSTHYYETVDNIITINHNLGYLAPFIVIYNGSTTIGQTKSYMSSPSVLPTYLDVVNEYLHVEQSINDLKITVGRFFDDEGGAVAGDTMYYTVYQFLNDFTSITGTNINTGIDSGTSSTDYGIRISKLGYDVKTCDDINCVLSSSFYNQIIHSCGLDTSGDTTINISHNLGYIPSYLVFVKEASGSSYIRMFTQTQATTTNLTISNPSEYYGFYYIIFKQKNG
jgi:hypothetical protein